MRRFSIIDRIYSKKSILAKVLVACGLIYLSTLFLESMGVIIFTGICIDILFLKDIEKIDWE